MTPDQLIYHLQQHLDKRGTATSMKHAAIVIKELERNIEKDRQREIKFKGTVNPIEE